MDLNKLQEMRESGEWTCVNCGYSYWVNTNGTCDRCGCKESIEEWMAMVNKCPNLNKEIVCRTCGFMTLNPMDMLEHLALLQRYPEENCKKKLIKFMPKEKDNDERIQ